MERLSTFSGFPQYGIVDDKKMYGIVTKFLRPDDDKKSEEFKVMLECVTKEYVVMKINFFNTQRKRYINEYVGYLRDAPYSGQPDNGDVRAVSFTADEVKQLKKEESDNPTKRTAKRIKLGVLAGRNNK